jgi:hypothetical protein
MDTIANILSRKDFDVPPEVHAIKEYVQRYYNQDVMVTVQQQSIFIRHRSAALIGTLRLNAPALQKAAATEKRLCFRIGS